MKTSKISIKPPCPELRGSLAGMKYPAMLEIKADGEFCFIHIEKDNTFTVNKYGTVRQDFTALNKMEEDVLKECRSATFLGELMMDGGKAGALYTLLSNKTNDSLELYPFDIIEVDRQDLRNEDLLTRKEIMSTMLSHSAVCKMVDNDKEAQTYFEIAVKKGYEGVVIKPLNGKLVLANPCDWVKMKAKDQTDYKVILVDKTQERIEIEAPVVANGLTGAYIAVGVKCANKYKPFIKVGDSVTIEHQGVLASGSLRHPVLISKPEWK